MTTERTEPAAHLVPNDGPPSTKADSEPDECSTIEAARLLGLAVRSVQLMVDRGELQAWKTPGGHRRISRASVQHWQAERLQSARSGRAPRRPAETSPQIPVAAGPRVLLIEDSRHFQNLVSLLVRQHFPHVDLHVADDGIAGLALAGQLQPAVLLVDILLPGIDGAALITALRSHPAFGGCRLIVITSMDGSALDPYRFALTGVPVVHKPALVAELPSLLAAALAHGPDVAASPTPTPTPTLQPAVR